MGICPSAQSRLLTDHDTLRRQSPLPVLASTVVALAMAAR